MWPIYLTVYIAWLYLSMWLQTAEGANGQCEFNLCEEAESGFLCEKNSLILIQTVMCRTRGRNCDQVAFREVTRICSGRQYCDSSDLWLVSGKYCEQNDRPQFLSIVFVSYSCIKAEAVESRCNKRGTRVIPTSRYVSSPGYPALVTGNSECVWKISPPPGFDVDISVREYLHIDETGVQFLKILETRKKGADLKVDMTSKRDLTLRLEGDVEIQFLTEGSTKGHRMWIEYRYVTKSSLEHLREFPALNKTECGLSLLNGTDFPGRHAIGKDKSSNIIPTSTLTTTSQSSSSSSSPSSPSATHKDKSHPSETTRAPPGVNDKDNSPNTAITVAIAVCAVGLACCVVAIWVTCRHRKKKASANSRNCLATDTYSVEYDRASLTSSSHPYTRPTPLVTTPRHPHPLGMVDIIRQGEMVQLKSGLYSPPETIIEAPPGEDNELTPMSQRTDANGDTLDLSKYLITDSENPTNTMTNSSQHSSNGHIYDVVREH